MEKIEIPKRTLNISSIILILALVVNLVLFLFDVEPIKFLFWFGIAMGALYAILVGIASISYLVLLWFFLLPFAVSWFRVDMGFANIGLTRIVFLIAIVGVFVNQVSGRQRLLPNGKLEVMLVLFSLAVLFSMVRAGTIKDRNVIGDFLQFCLLPTVAYFLAKNFVNQDKYLKVFYIGLIVLAIYLSFTAIFESFGPHWLVFPDIISMRKSPGRAVGPFLNPVANGYAITTGIFVAGMYVFRDRHSLRLFLCLATALMLIGLFLTKTRINYVGFVLGFITIAFFESRFRKWSFVFLTGLTLLIAFNWHTVKTSDRDKGGVGELGTIQSRIIMHAASWRMFQRYPIWGVGFGRYEDVLPNYLSDVGQIPQERSDRAPHNRYMALLAETGIVGGGIFLVLLSLIFRRFIKGKQIVYIASETGRRLCTLFIIVSVYFIMIGVTTDITGPFSNCLFLFVVGAFNGYEQRLALGIENQQSRIF